MANHVAKPQRAFAEANEVIFKLEVSIVTAGKAFGAFDQLALHGLCRSLNREAHYGRAAAGVGAKIERRMGGVERRQLNTFGRETEFLRCNLAERRVRALADLDRAFEESDFTIHVDLATGLGNFVVPATVLKAQLIRCRSPDRLLPPTDFRPRAAGLPSYRNLPACHRAQTRRLFPSDS